jgi:hypothetical protein
MSRLESPALQMPDNQNKGRLKVGQPSGNFSVNGLILVEPFIKE